MHESERVIREYFAARTRGDDSDELLIAPNFKRLDPPPVEGHKAFVAWKQGLRRVCADENWEVLRVTCDGDDVWVWLRNGSTRVGEWHGLAASGMRVHFETVNLLTVRDGKIVAMRRVADDWSRVRPLGSTIEWEVGGVTTSNSCAPSPRRPCLELESPAECDRFSSAWCSQWNSQMDGVSHRFLPTPNLP